MYLICIHDTNALLFDDCILASCFLGMKSLFVSCFYGIYQGKTKCFEDRDILCIET